MPPVLPAADAIISEDLETSKVTTVLLQPENCCRVRTANHVTYSIDTKPKHTVRGSPLWTVQKKLDDSCVPPNLPFNITNKTNKQTNTTKYRKPKNDNMITKYVWWLQAFAFCNYNAIANFFKFTTSTHCKYIQQNLECRKKL